MGEHEMLGENVRMEHVRNNYMMVIQHYVTIIQHLI